MGDTVPAPLEEPGAPDDAEDDSSSQPEVPFPPKSSDSEPEAEPSLSGSDAEDEAAQDEAEANGDESQAPPPVSPHSGSEEDNQSDGESTKCGAPTVYYEKGPATRMHKFASVRFWGICIFGTERFISPILGSRAVSHARHKDAKTGAEPVDEEKACKTCHVGGQIRT